MMIHQLKTDPEMFDAVAAGTKTFEIRKNDRNYQVDDVLVLCKTLFTGAQMAPHPEKMSAALVYTGEIILAQVTHILHGPMYGLAEGWSIMSIQPEDSE